MDSLEIDKVPKRYFDRSESLRSTFDRVLVAVSVIPLVPVFALIALLIKLDDGGPVFFSQERLGRHRSTFRMVKFRTMRVDNDESIHRDYIRSCLIAEVAPHGGEEGIFKIVKDPRVTRAGSFLRATSLDELPQLYNVMRGEMALVGPRPVLAYEADLFPADVESRFSVRPGLTGLWQVNGRGAVDMRTALLMDVEYVQTRSFAGDLKLILRTFRALVGQSVAH